MALGLVSVISSVVTLPIEMLCDTKRLDTFGATAGVTTRFALTSDISGDDSRVVRDPEGMVLVIVPDVSERTSTAMVHVPLAAKYPPDKTSPESLAETLPPHVWVRLATAANFSEEGKTSDKAIPVSKLVLGLDRVRVKRDVPPMATLVGENDLRSVGGRGRTVRLADVTWVELPALVLETAPIGRVFVYVPDVLAVTFMVNVHVPLARIVPPVNASVRVPPVYVGVPPQLELSPGDPLADKPEGKTSVAATPVSATKLSL